MSKTNYDICIIGHGNVGSHLAWAFDHAGAKITAIVGRRSEIPQLAIQVGAQYITNLSDIPDSQFVILAIPDDAISDLSLQLRDKVSANSVILHVSGSTGCEILRDHKQYGSMWPVQSIRYNQTLDWKSVPIVISTSSSEVTQRVSDLCSLLSEHVHIMSDEQKSLLHPAAVMANNFPTWILGLTYEFCKEHSLPFEVLLPLIKETASKVISNKNPMDFVTGPARRDDESTIRRHLNQLSGLELHFEVYSQMTVWIRSYYSQRSNESNDENSKRMESEKV